VVSTDPSSCTPSISSVMTTPENTGGDLDNPGPADEGGIQVEYSSDNLYSPSVWAVTKK
jgi:hypothetical protein